MHAPEPLHLRTWPSAYAVTKGAQKHPLGDQHDRVKSGNLTLPNVCVTCA
jgi:hypothetical protein